MTEIVRSLESTGAAALPSWLTVEGLLTPVEMGVKMRELNNINIYNHFIISSLHPLYGGEGGIRSSRSKDPSSASCSGWTWLTWASATGTSVP